MIAADVWEWIAHELRPRQCGSTEFIYDLQESQSGECLPLIYQPFDAGNRGHWADRGSAWDYLLSTGEGRLLDFGPGDGWPSLLVAPYCAHVTGVDASARRVAVCRANAARLGITNAEFAHVPSGAALPFADASFDGAMAATSVEQTPDPLFTLCELFRVLKLGGALRLAYESLERYRGGMEQGVHLPAPEDRPAHLLVYDRQVEREQADQYRLSYALSGAEVRAALARHGLTPDNPWRSGPPAPELPQLSVALLAELRPALSEAVVCRTQHPNGATFSRLLHQAGFAPVRATHGGAQAAHALFGHLAPDARPTTLDGVDRMVRPVVATALELAAPLSIDPMLTAVKAGA